MGFRLLSHTILLLPERITTPRYLNPKDRDGFVFGEGTGAVILEEYEHAKKRGANHLDILVAIEDKIVARSSTPCRFHFETIGQCERLV